MYGSGLIQGMPIMQKVKDDFTTTEREDLRKQLNTLVATGELTVRQLASSVLQASGSVASQILKGKYTGDSDKYLKRAERWLAERDQLAVTPDVQFVMTDAARHILQICMRAWQMPCMAKIVLDSGAGKTAALMEFHRRRIDQSVYLQAGQAANSQRGFLKDLARQLRIVTPSLASAPTLYRFVRDHLAGLYGGGKSTPFSILVDEATTLGAPCLNILRNLHDDQSVRAAVVMADTRRMEGELASRGGIAGGYEQLTSRFGAVFAPPPGREIPRKDVRGVAEGVVGALGYRGRLAKESVAYLHRIANRPGQFRNVVYRLRTVHDLAEQAGVEATYSVAELDSVAPLVGAECEMDHHASPFGRPAQGQVQQKAAAVG